MRGEAGAILVLKDGTMTRSSLCWNSDPNHVPDVSVCVGNVTTDRNLIKAVRSQASLLNSMCKKATFLCGLSIGNQDACGFRWGMENLTFRTK